MPRDYARSQTTAEDAEVETLHRLGEIGAWSCGTFALAGLVILLFAGAVLPWRSEAATYALRHGMLLLTPGILWGGLLVIFSSTDKRGLADFGMRVVATSLMFVGVGVLFAGYCACNRYFLQQDAEPWAYLPEGIQVLVACVMPGLCLLSGLSMVAVYRSVVTALDYVANAGLDIREGKGQSATTPPRWGFCHRRYRYRSQGMSEDYLA